MQVKYKGNVPKYMSKGAAGADLSSVEKVIIAPSETHTIKTGTYLEIPDGFMGLLTPRSSLCNKGGLQLVNSVGIIDSDYRGELMMVYRNLGNEPVEISEGERIGQIIFLPSLVADFISEDLTQTDRGEGGFGSTGVKDKYYV